MTVILQEDHRVPSVSVRLRYEGGEAAAPAGLEGAAPLTTHLMLQASKHVAPGDYYRLLARAGASSPFDVTFETGAALETTLPSNQLALPLWLWSDQMGFFADALDDAQLTRKRSQLREQRHGAEEGSPTGRLDLFADEELFPPEHPYHRSFLRAADIEHVDRAAVLAFHDRWITPPHATLVVVGDVASGEALALVERYFGSIPRGNEEHLQRPGQVVLPGDIRLTVAANTPRAEISVRWVTPRLLTTEDGRLDVLAHCLSGTRTAWLLWKLVDQRKVAAKVSARQRSRDLASEFEVRVEGAPGHSAAELLAAFDAAMDEIRARPATGDEIGYAAYEYLIDRPTAFERPAFRAAEYSKYTALVGDPGYFRHDFERYEGITPEILRSTIDTWLPRDRRVVMLVTPTPSAPPGGEVIGRTVIAAGAR
jgi:zinc protease